MKNHNFILGPVDTDSISICKPDMSEFTEEEQEALLEEINSLMPPKIQYAHDGYFKRCVAIKAKNYVLYDGKKIKVKGSALKASTKSAALKLFNNQLIEILCYTDKKEEMLVQIKQLYNRYAKEICNLKTVEDIKKYSARKTISSTMLESERANETKVMDALKGKTYTEGDRIWIFYKQDDSVALTEDFNGDYNVGRLHKNLFDTVSIFDTILPIKELFPNYSLKKNKKLLETL
jgi:DNA polymerase elongation subunit (family B)